MTYYLPVCYLLRIQRYSVNITYNKFIRAKVPSYPKRKLGCVKQQTHTHTLWGIAKRREREGEWKITSNVWIDTGKKCDTSE